MTAREHKVHKDTFSLSSSNEERAGVRSRVRFLRSERSFAANSD